MAADCKAGGATVLPERDCREPLSHLIRRVSDVVVGCRCSQPQPARILCAPKDTRKRGRDVVPGSTNSGSATQ
eukprot:1917852-Rhodomonas_salina.5